MCMLGCVVLRAWTDVAIARSLRPRFPQVPLPFVLPKRRHVAGRVGLQHRGASIESLGEVTRVFEAGTIVTRCLVDARTTRPGKVRAIDAVEYTHRGIGY